MTRIQWDRAGEKRYKAGLDRGVFYPESGVPGIAWNGLLNVNIRAEAPVESDLYYDGLKRGSVVDAANVKGSLEAFTYPTIFDEYCGFTEIDEGVYADEQPYRRFGLSYRTLVGNDLDGIDYGYKIHIVYNLLAYPSDAADASIVASLAADSMSWSLSGRPVSVPNGRPTGHLVLDSRRLQPGHRGIIEDILYGTSSTSPRLLLPEEVVQTIIDQRFVIPISKALDANIPKYAIQGDYFLETSTGIVYSWWPYAGNTRDVIVIPTNDPELLPSDVYPGDMVYVESEGVIYRIEE